MQPTRCNVIQFIYFYEILYMFHEVPPPIIRSSNCIYSIGIYSLSSWWWAEKPLETCRAFHRNK